MDRAQATGVKRTESKLECYPPFAKTLRMKHPAITSQQFLRARLWGLILSRPLNHFLTSSVSEKPGSSFARQSSSNQYAILGARSQMKTHILIDYDNLPANVKGGGLASLARMVNRTVEVQYPSVAEIGIRLYGGWYDINGLTRVGTSLAQEIGTVFPLVIATNGHIGCRIHCDIASSLIDTPADLLLHTFRQRKGMRSRLTVAQVPNCANPSSCSAQAVARWSRGRCHVAGCSVSAQSVFTFSEQKLVDTLLCCDLLAIAMRGQTEPVFVISDDDDMVPAMLLGGRLGGAIHVLEGRARQSAYGALLQRYNIQITSL
jgi:hypothetical protein